MESVYTHLVGELDSIENRQIAIHKERAALDAEEQALLSRKLVIRVAIAEVLEA